MDTKNAEAGPSRRAQSDEIDISAARFSAVTPPRTPAKAKRRSWFSFASPSQLLSGSPGPSNPGSRENSKYEGLELTDTARKVDDSRRSTDSRGQSTPTGRASVEMTQDKEEVLTIDAEPEQTIKKKKSKRRSLKNDDGKEGEVVRMKELSSSSMRQEAVRKSHDPGGDTVELVTPKIDRFDRRTFSRTASDRDPFVVTSPANADVQKIVPVPVFSTAIPRANLEPQATSSITSSDRPLPALPPSDAEKALPQVPSGIFITPSSPHKPTSRTHSHPVGSSPSSRSSLTRPDHRSRSTSRSRTSRDSSQSRTLRNVKSFNLGLGLPRNDSDASIPPAVPSKAQSVSSPLPSRGPSPTPRIAFAEPAITKTDRKTSSATTDGDTTDTEKRGRAKRARSLSGLLTRPQIDNIVSSRSASPERAEEQITVKASGVLGWLGVKKIVKRRTSESKLGDMEHTPDEASARTSVDTPMESRDGHVSRESLRGQATLKGRPHLLPHSSSITVVPDTFDLTRSGRTSMEGGSRDPSPGTRRGIRPAPISIISPRNSFATSRSSSHSNRPDANVASNSTQWATSPTEQEETLYSPESVNWGPGVRPWMDGLDGRRSNRSSMSTPLGSLPEQGPLSILQPNVEPNNQPPTGRLRSWSDAPLPQPQPPQQGNDHHFPSGARSVSPTAQSPFGSPARPSMPGRTSSANSLIMGKVRSVFGKSGGRGRSQTLFRQPSSDVDDFGPSTSKSGYPSSERMRPSSSASSAYSSVRPNTGADSTHMALLGLSSAERGIFSIDTPDRSPRTSIMAPSISSLQSTSSNVVRIDAPKGRNGRARASTMFSRPTSTLIPPPAPQAIPIAATPPRRRPSVMQRFSSGMLRSGQGSPRGGLFPLPPRSNGSMSSGMASPLGPDDPNSLLTSPRPSSGSVSAAMGHVSLKALLAREEGDTPETWLERVVHRVGRGDIADVLAASGDDFHSQALNIYMSRFDFTQNALDVALRRLLMHLSLPRETQQIDRIIEAFAARYEFCEPGLFISKDNTYVLAFSMMMLHTDAFNRHNKNKMTKTDYVRNTRMEGVHPLVLEAFFDNITFTPFVFVEDDMDVGREPLSASTFATVSSSALTSGTKNSKIDVYHMIVDDTLGSLRVNVESAIPVETQYSCTGTSEVLDTQIAHRAFLDARDMVIVPPKRKTSAAALLGSTPSRSRDPAPDQETALKITKIGLLSRRQNTSEGKKSSRKWKPWTVILTGSQILFFKDPAMAPKLLEHVKQASADENRTSVPRMTNFKPDEVFPLKSGIAVLDMSDTTPNTFRYVIPHHRQYLLQAADETEMNEWISLINYASAFKTANVRIRAMSLGKNRAVLAGAAAAASHQRDMKIAPLPAERFSSLPRSPRKAFFGEVEKVERSHTPPMTDFAPSPLKDESVSSVTSKEVLDVEGANGVLNEGEQLEEVFDAVKAELAAGRGGAPRVSPKITRLPKEHLSRQDVVRSQIAELERKSSQANESLQSSLLLARNLAILTPFQKSTKDRIASGVSSLASRIRDIRLDLARLGIWLAVLRDELEHEEREMTRLRHVALQAAARSLRDPLGVKGVVQEVNAGEPGVPVLELPDSEDDEDDMETRQQSGGDDSRSSAELLGRSPGELPIMIRRSSEQVRERGRKPQRPGGVRQDSTHSVHSLRSVGSDMKRSDSSFLSVHDTLDRSSPQADETITKNAEGETGGSTPLFPLSDGEDEGTIRAARPNLPGVSDGGLEGDMDDVPEEWIKTRAARRVSLAQFPPIPPRLSSIVTNAEDENSADAEVTKGQK